MKFIFGYLLIIGTIFCFVVPPFQKPDETVHFKKAVAVSSGIFGCSKNNQTPLDKQFVNLVNNSSLQQIIAQKNKKLSASFWRNEVLTTKTNRVQKYLDTSNSCQLPVVAYLPQVSGLWLSRIFNLNAYWSFFLGRFIGFLFYFLWFYCLLKNLPKSIKPILLLTFSLPMTLHQLSSYSYDGAQIMFAQTLFVSMVQLIKNRYKKINWWIILALGLFGFLATRTIVKVSYPSSINPLGQFILLKNSPFSFVEIIFKTTFLKFPFYLQGLVGIFGWLEYGLDYFTYFFYSILITIAIYQTKLEKKIVLSKLLHALLGCLLTAYYLLVLFVNYFFWTSYRSKIIEGVQGRYFIIIFPFLLLFLINFRQTYFPRLKPLKIFIPKKLIVFFATIIVVLIFRSILLRFYF